MSIDKNNILEISQVGNGFIVRTAASRWFDNDLDKRWVGARDDYLVFRTMAELQQFLQNHFSHRDIVVKQDEPRPSPLATGTAQALV